MKKLLFTIILINSYSLSIFAQPKLVEQLKQIYVADSTKWRNADLLTNIYDSQGRLIEEFNQIWFSARWDWGNRSRTNYSYNEEGLLEQKIHNFYQAGTDNYQNYYTDTYEYDENGCLINLTDEVLSIHADYPQYYFTYENNEDCLPIKQIRSNEEWDGSYTFEENSYVYNVDNQLLIDSMFIEKNGEMTFYQVTLFEYDEEGRVVFESRLRAPGFTQVHEFKEWEYDDLGEVTHFVKWRDSNFSSYQIIERDSIIVAYDDQDRLIDKRTFHWRFDDLEPEIHETFAYYCDEDVLKSSTIEESSRLFRYRYKYDVGFEEDCMKEMEDKSILLFPNPVRGEWLKIESDMLAGNMTRIFIYDVLGRQRLVNEFFSLANYFDLNLPYLQAGTYFLTIENSNGIETAKFRVFYP